MPHIKTYFNHIKRYDFNVANSIKCYFLEKLCFLTLRRWFLKVDSHYNFSLWKDRLGFLKNLPLGLRPEIILSRCPSTAQRMNRNLKSQWERKENWFGCFMLQILFFQAYMQTALKTNLSENYPSYFHNFQKTHGPVDIPLRSSVLRVIECSTAWNSVKLSEALGSNGLMNHR